MKLSVDQLLSLFPGFSSVTSLQGFYEVKKDNIYDRVTFAAGSTFSSPVTLFGSPQGGTVTLSQTNMRAAGQLGNNEYFLFTSFGIHIWEATIPADAQLLSQYVTAEFLLSTSSKFRGPIWLYPQYGGVSGRVDQPYSAGGTTQAQNPSAAWAWNGLGKEWTFEETPYLASSQDNIQVILAPSASIQFTTNTQSAVSGLPNPIGQGTSLTAVFGGYRLQPVGNN